MAVFNIYFFPNRLTFSGFLFKNFCLINIVSHKLQSGTPDIEHLILKTPDIENTF